MMTRFGVCLNCTTLSFKWLSQNPDPPPSPRPVSGWSLSPAGWTSPRTWRSSRETQTWWWSALPCCSGWWWWRDGHVRLGPEGGSSHTSPPACTGLAAVGTVGGKGGGVDRKKRGVGERELKMLPLIAPYVQLYSYYWQVITLFAVEVVIFLKQLNNLLI